MEIEGKRREGNMNNFKEPSLIVSRQKAQMICNRIKPIFEDVLGHKINLRDESKIDSIILFMLRDDGYERINTEAIEANGYIKMLCSECQRIKSMLANTIETGQKDFRTKEWK